MIHGCWDDGTGVVRILYGGKVVYAEIQGMIGGNGKDGSIGGNSLSEKRWRLCVMVQYSTVQYVRYEIGVSGS